MVKEKESMEIKKNDGCKESLLAPGHSTCAGCGPAIVMRQILEAAGKDIVVCQATGCMEVTTTQYPMTSWKVPWIHVTFENAASVASGVKEALTAQGKPEVQVIALAGDGGMVDIGFGALSGALERGHDILYICYDNEAYANCLSLSTTIMTSQGLKKITDVQKGDMIYAFDQKAHQLVLKKCSGVFDNGRKDVYELGTLHHSIKTTANHPFLTLKRNGRGKQNTLVWKTLLEIKNGDEIVVLKHLDMNRSHEFGSIRMSKKGDYKVTHVNKVSIPKKSSPELMEYLGLYVGDGWSRVARGEIGFAIPEKTAERKRLVRLHSALFKSEATSQDENYVYFGSVNLARFIDSLGFGHGAKNKTIPDWVFTLPEEEKEAFVRGLMLSDGHREGHSLRYGSSSHELLKRLRLLLQTMSYRVGKIHWWKIEKGKHVVYRALLKDTESGYVCFSRRKKWNVRKYPSQYRYQNFLIRNESFEMEKVKYKRLIGVESTLDLRVEDEHNFIADGIVVHNTGIQRSGATPMFASTTTTPAGTESQGKPQWKKNVPFIAVAHGAKYVATASLAYPQDLKDKIRKAMSVRGPKYIHIHAPCPIGWVFDSWRTVDIAKLAVETGAWVLFEVEEGKFRKTKSFETLKPLKEYLSLQGRYKHLKDENIAAMEKHLRETWKELDVLEKSGVNLVKIL